MSRKQNDERGMVSILITMFLIIIITLIVLGFAQLVRRNQRSTLDRQMSSQAFYAAETGVNDARQVISRYVSEHPDISRATLDKLQKPDCTANPNPYHQLKPVIDDDKDISYSCLTVNPLPKELRYSNVGDQSLVIPVITNDDTLGNAVRKITFRIKSKTSSTTPMQGCDGLNPFPSNQGWVNSGCGYGVLGIDIVPVTGGGFDFSNLSMATMTTFAMPRSGGSGSIPYSPGAGNPRIVSEMRCDNDECTFEITGLSQTSYYMKVASLYRPVSMEIGAEDNSGRMSFRGAQAVIDSTCKAGDVLRRIQVHVPLRSSSKNQIVNHALQTKYSICKRFWAMSGRLNSEPGGASGPAGLCQTFDRH